MEKYYHKKRYVLFGGLISLVNVSLQAVLIILVSSAHLSWPAFLLAFLVAYFFTDLLNGLIHMVMDHHENFRSFYGPLVAQFHLHHKTPVYSKKPIFQVYFHESGAKIWLVPYLLLILLLVQSSLVSDFVLITLVMVGVLSSVAEVSHYLCHTSKARTVTVLASLGVLLSRRHHTRHHARDNMNYAFLNGMSDPIINVIARSFFNGYKSTTDTHYATYQQEYVAQSR